MKTTTEKTLYWAPRILGIAAAAFISIFALDVFGQNHSFWETLIALAMHLIPTGMIVLALILGWRWEWLGALLFLGVAAAYVIMAWGKFPLSTYFIISGPLAVVGILFGVHWLAYRKMGV